MTEEFPFAQVEQRKFDLGDVLSVTTGRLLCPVTARRTHPIDGVYDILGYMTGESLMTHQLPRVCKEAAPVLLALYPSLAAVNVHEFTDHSEVGLWLAEQRKIYGDSFAVPKFSADQHKYKDPISEIVEMVGPDRVIVVKP